MPEESVNSKKNSLYSSFANQRDNICVEQFFFAKLLAVVISKSHAWES